MKLTRSRILRFVLFSISFFCCRQAYPQNPWDWGLSTICNSGFQFSSRDHSLCVNAKYTSRNFRSALFNYIHYYSNAKLSIHQLDTSEYRRWVGVNSMVIMRDTVETLGGYSKLLYVGGSTSNYAKDFETDADDNYIIAADNAGNGWVFQNPVNSNFGEPTQLLLVKITSSGTLMWNKTYGGSKADYAISVKKTSDGNLLVLAETQSADGDVTSYHGGKDIWLLKINNSDGSIMWQKTIGTAEDEMPGDMEILTDGSIVIAGAAGASALFPSTSAGANAFLLKLDANGNFIWSRVFGGNGEDKIQAFVPLPDGFVSIGNSTSSDGDYPANNGGSDVYVFRHDAAGSILWKKNYGFAGNDLAGDVAFVNCDSMIYASFAREYNGLPQSFTTYPAYCQNTGIRLALDKNGNQTYYYQDVFYYPYSNGDESLSRLQTPSIAANNKGGILSTNITHLRWGTGFSSGDRGNVTRSFDMYEYGVKLKRRYYDTTVCAGQPVWGNSYVNDTSFSDTLRNRCNIDTLINKYQIRILNADSAIHTDTTLCYGALYNGSPQFASFVEYDTSVVNTICGNRLLISVHEVKIAPSIINGFTDDTIVCNKQVVRLQAYTPAQSYTWSNGAVTSFINANDTGLYWVTVTDTFGCVITDSIQIKSTDLYLGITPRIILSTSEPLVLQPSTNGVLVWTSDPTLSCINCQNPLASPLATTTYYVSASKDNCTSYDSIQVIVTRNFYMYIPNAFTPNGDDRNRLFRVTTNYTGDFSMQIYNRYGQSVFRSSDVSYGWDGTLKSTPQPAGNYVYLVTFKKPNGVIERRKGNVLLLRN